MSGLLSGWPGLKERAILICVNEATTLLDNGIA
jgi:hypothetical protein